MRISTPVSCNAQRQHSRLSSYYENVEGGHGGAADNKQRAFMNVLAYDFLEQALTGSRKGEAAAPKK